MKDSNDNDGDNCDDDNNNDYKRPQKPLKNDSFATRGFPTSSPVILLKKICYTESYQGSPDK